MKTRTQDLIGPALDWAVAKCEGASADALDSYVDGMRQADEGAYSTDWSQGGPIIEREAIAMQFTRSPMLHYCTATAYDGEQEEWGDTALIAAMRCYVASKLGNEVDVPEELLPCPE